MSLIYISGSAGSGKSTICDELKRRGYTAYDADEGGISFWRNIQTGESVFRSDEERVKEWYDKHDWAMSRSKVEELAAIAKNQDVFLFGSTSNEEELFSLFDKIFYLKLDEKTLIKRLTERTNNDYGKAPDELKNEVSWVQGSLEKFERAGATILDATLPVNELVEKLVFESR